jgi:A/G-specific adenine glycosylase
LRDDPRRGPTRARLWQLAEALLPKLRVGEFNQALMELGALVCTPAAPRCGACPLAAHCVARRLGLQAEIPARPEAPATVEVREAAVVLRRGAQVLLVQRPSEGRWANLWEFPHGPLEDGETHEAAATRVLRQLTGLNARPAGEILTIRHGVTRFQITMVCFEAAYRAGEFRSTFYRQGVWLEPAQLAAYPVSAPQRRLAAALGSGPRQRQLF